MSRLDRILAGALWALGVLLAAAAAHVGAVLLLPRIVGEPPMRRLAALARPGETTLLPRATPAAQWAPFLDPALAQSVCLFDLARGPVRVSGPVDPERMLTLSFRAPDGEIFYSMSEHAAQRGTIEVLLLTNDQLDALEAEDEDDEEPTQELRLVAPSPTGFVLVNALADFPGERADAERRAAAISCKREEPPAP